MRGMLWLIAEDRGIDYRGKHPERGLKQEVVEQRQPGSLSLSKPRDRVVDSAHRQWLAHRQKRPEQIPVVLTKSGLGVRQQSKRLGDGLDTPAEDSTGVEGIVSTCADEHVRSAVAEPVQLFSHIDCAGAIDRKEG